MTLIHALCILIAVMLLIATLDSLVTTIAALNARPPGPDDDEADGPAIW